MLATLFMVLSTAVAAVVAYASRSSRIALGILVWMALSAGLAWSGVLRDFSSLPPAAPVLFVSGFFLTIFVGCYCASPAWLQLSSALLIGFQSFRILVELLIHQAVTEGIAPPQMTWSGLNLDIITGVTALMLAPFANRAPRRLLLAWNTLGLVLLVWVVSVATISFPTRFQILTPSNTWVAEFPYVWLPSILVSAALLGHILLYRRLAR